MKKYIIFITMILLPYIYYLNAPLKTSTASIEKSKKIIVLGSQPECIAAAVTASRLDYDVILLTSSEKLGGLLVEGMLTAIDLNYDNNKNILHKGFFKEFMDNCSNGYNIDLDLAEAYFNNIVDKYNIQCIYNVSDYIPIVNQKNRVVGVTMITNGSAKDLFADFIVDGTDEAYFTRKLGVSYRKGRSELGLPDVYAAATLVFSVKGANWSEITDYLNHDNNPESGHNKNSAWGFNTMYQYKSLSQYIQMRGLNLSKQNNGSIIINGLLIYGVDPTNPESITKSYNIAKQELPNIINYLRKNIAGFGHCTLDKVATKLYIREGIRIVGEDTLTGNDIYDHTRFPNWIAYGSYPMDLQSAYKGDYGNALGTRSLYSIPLGVMIPQNVNNLLVIGRSASFDILAHGSTRTIPVLIAMSEGGMYAVNYSLKNNISLAQLNRSMNDLKKLQLDVKEVYEMHSLHLPTNRLNMQWYYPYLYSIRSKGFYTTGYRPYNLDEASNTKRTISSTISLVVSHSPIVISDEIKEYIHSLKKEPSETEICTLISLMLKKEYNSFRDLRNDNIIDDIVYTHLLEDKILTHAHIYALLDCVITKMSPYKGTYFYKSKESVKFVS